MSDRLRLTLIFFSLVAAVQVGCGKATPVSLPTTTPISTSTTTPTTTPTPTPTRPRVQVTYVGNSGFLITAGDKKVLIDAIFEGFPPGYTLPDNVTTLLLNAQPPFDDVDLVVATHNHADHFSASLVRLYMLNNQKAIFISTTQVASQLADLGSRVIAVDPIAGAPVSLEANGIKVEAIYLSHGIPQNPSEEIYNNGYVVTINGIKFFHTGDISDPEDILQYKLAEQHIDLAFFVHFYLQDSRSRSIIKNGIGAKYLIPIHYQFTDLPFKASRIKINYPDAVIFSQELDSWIMP